MWIPSCLVLILVDIGGLHQVQSFSLTKGGLRTLTGQRSNQPPEGPFNQIRGGETDQLQTDSPSALHATAILTPPAETVNRSPLVKLVTSIQKLFQGIWRMFRGTMLQRSDAELKSGIAKFYDESSQIWLDVWGEHMHHGYYPTPQYADHIQAQIDMIDRTLDWAYGGAPPPAALPRSMIDVGCGVGGSSRHIAKKWGLLRAKGVSLSPFQIGKAREFTAAAGLNGVCEYAVEDAMKLSSSGSSSSSSGSSSGSGSSSASSPAASPQPLQYDLTWSMESGEHMPNKAQFVNELYRVTAPGGRIIIVTWCHRELTEGESALRGDEIRLLGKISDAYYLPEWCPASLYVKEAEALGLTDVRQADWSEFIAPFWGAVFTSALGGPFPRNLIRLLQSGPTTVKGAIATLWMLRGFKRGVIKFALVTGKKSSD